jgi:hypothetical protein
MMRASFATFGAATLVSFIAPSQMQAQESIVEPYLFSRGAPGSFLIKTGKELGSNEAAALITTACAAFGVNCAPAAKALQSGSKAAYRNDGETHVVIFDPPAGYEPCRARIDWNSASLTGETTFSGAIGNYSGELKFGVNAVVPRHRPSGQWVHAMVFIQSVPKGTREQNGCWPTKTNFWLCRNGGNNCSFYPGARLADQANYR